MTSDFSRAFNDRSNCTKAAKRALGNNDAKPGVDFEIKTVKGAEGPAFAFRLIEASPETSKSEPLTDDGLAMPGFLKRQDTAEDAAIRERVAASASGKVRHAPAPASLGAAAVKAPAAAAPAAKGKSKAKGGKAAAGSKTALVAGLLQSAKGTTTKDILKATGWPAVSVPQMASAAGLDLRKEKVAGEPTRYFGTPSKAKATRAAAENRRPVARRGRA